MHDDDLGDARRLARENTRLAVRRFAREATLDAAQSVSQACNRVRMLDEMRNRQRHQGADRS